MQNTDEDPFASYGAAPDMPQFHTMGAMGGGASPAPPQHDDPWGTVTMTMGAPPAAVPDNNFDKVAPAMPPAPAMAHPPAPVAVTPTVEEASETSAESIPFHSYYMAPRVPNDMPAYMPPAPPASMPPPVPASMPPEMPPVPPPAALTNVATAAATPVHDSVPATVVVLNDGPNASPPSPMTMAPPSPEQQQMQQGQPQRMKTVAPVQQQAPAPPMPFAPTMMQMQAPVSPLQMKQHHSPLTQANPFDFGFSSSPSPAFPGVSPAVSPGAQQQQWQPASTNICYGLENQMNNLSIMQQHQQPNNVGTPASPVAPSYATAPTFAFAGAPASMPPALPTHAPPSPPKTDGNATRLQQQPMAFPNIQPPSSPTTAPLSPMSPLSPQTHDPFGYAFRPMTSPNEFEKMTTVQDMWARVDNNYGAGFPEVPSLGGDNFFTNSSQNGNYAIVPAASQSADPWGVFETQPTHPAAATQAIVPSHAHNNVDPFGVFGDINPPVPADPFAGSSFVDSTALVPADSNADDPFGIFGTPSPVAAPAPPQVQVNNALVPSTSPVNDPWAVSGFGSQQAPGVGSQRSIGSVSHVTTSDHPSNGYARQDNATPREDEIPIQLDQNSLPSSGEYYEARINARSLGAMFYTARDLEETLLRRMPSNVIEAMGSRPVVAYVAEHSAAENSGVHLGHCVLSVNGHTVKNEFEMLRHAAVGVDSRGGEAFGQV